jgi:hypothetical protein
MNVQHIHNSSFARSLPDGDLAQVRALANWHEYNLFSDPKIDGIGNIAGRTILPSILSGFRDIANSTLKTKMVMNVASYKPFMSLFNMTGVAAKNQELAGIGKCCTKMLFLVTRRIADRWVLVVDYASAVAFEVRQPQSDTGRYAEPVIRLAFKNGTDDFKVYNMFGSSGDTPLSTVLNTLNVRHSYFRRSVCSSRNANLSTPVACGYQRYSGMVCCMWQPSRSWMRCILLARVPSRWFRLGVLAWRTSQQRRRWLHRSGCFTRIRCCDDRSAWLPRMSDLCSRTWERRPASECRVP